MKTGLVTSGRQDTQRHGRNVIRHGFSTLLLVLAAAAPAAYAQGGDLNATQQLGRQVYAQSCGVCHLQPSLGVKTYGPALNMAAAGGNDEAMRAYIVNGTERMPAFKYYLKPAEISAIIAYLKTVPVPAAPDAPKKGEAR
jgi:mono/diheme cytochrome c family protein